MYEIERALLKNGEINSGTTYTLSLGSSGVFLATGGQLYGLDPDGALHAIPYPEPTELVE